MDTIILGALIVGIVQVFKMTFVITKRYIPITTIMISCLVFGTWALSNHVPLSWAILESALISALTAIGLWSGTKTSIK